jgi:prohibitin 2
MAVPPNIAALAGSVGTLAKVVVLGGLGVYGAANSIFNVEGGHRAIVFNRLVGIKDKVRCQALARVAGVAWRLGGRKRGSLPLPQVYPEGTHLMLPWFEHPIIYDVRARPSLIQSQSGSRDLQMVRRGTALQDRRGGRLG